jgi:hypothetical protein
VVVRPLLLPLPLPRLLLRGARGWLPPPHALPPTGPAFIGKLSGSPERSLDQGQFCLLLDRGANKYASTGPWGAIPNEHATRRATCIVSTAGSSLVLAGLAALPALLLIAPLHAASVMFPPPAGERLLCARLPRCVTSRHSCCSKRMRLPIVRMCSCGMWSQSTSGTRRRPEILPCAKD